MGWLPKRDKLNLVQMLIRLKGRLKDEEVGGGYGGDGDELCGIGD